MTDREVMDALLPYLTLVWGLCYGFCAVLVLRSVWRRR